MYFFKYIKILLGIFEARKWGYSSVWLERLPCKQEVRSSTLLTSTNMRGENLERKFFATHGR